MEYVSQLSNNDHWYIENIFLCYEDERDQIQDVYVFQEGHFVKGEVQHVDQQFDGKDLSFDYVQFYQKIRTFHEQGLISYSLKVMHDNTMYFHSTDNDLYAFDLKTNKIQQITHDHKSVNSSISPQATYILINKLDEYWTIYNTNTKEERILEGWDPYAHNNEYYFLNDEQLLTYNGMIDLKTLIKTDYPKDPLYPQMSSFSYEYNDDKNKTVVWNMVTNEKKEVDMNFNYYQYSVNNNRYIILISTSYKKMAIYDFEKNKVIYVNYDQYIIFSNTEEYYITTLDSIFNNWC